MVEAIGLLRDRGLGARGVIVGEGGERAELERLIERLGLSHSVLLTGYRTDREDLLAAFDVAVCCSDFEGGPLSVMEYMDAALPVVATRVGGLPELISDEQTGLFIEPRQPLALADAIARLDADPVLREELGESARAFKRSRHSMDGWIESLEALYGRLLHGLT